MSFFIWLDARGRFIFVVLFSILASALLVNSNKIILSRINIPSGSAYLSAAHYLTTYVFLACTRAISGTSKKTNDVGLRDLLLTTFVGTFSVTSSNLMLRYSSVRFHQFFRILLIPGGLAFDYVRSKQVRTILEYLCVIQITVVVLVCLFSESLDEISARTPAYTFGILSVFSSLWTVTLIKDICCKFSLSTIDYVHVSAPWSSLSAIIWCFITAGASLNFVGVKDIILTRQDSVYLVINCFIAVCVNLSACWCSLHLSELAYGVLAQAKMLTTLFLGILIFRLKVNCNFFVLVAVCVVLCTCLAYLEGERKLTRTLSPSVTFTVSLILSLNCFALLFGEICQRSLLQSFQVNLSADTFGRKIELNTRNSLFGKHYESSCKLTAVAYFLLEPKFTSQETKENLELANFMFDTFLEISSRYCGTLIVAPGTEQIISSILTERVKLLPIEIPSRISDAFHWDKRWYITAVYLRNFAETDVIFLDTDILSTYKNIDYIFDDEMWDFALTIRPGPRYDTIVNGGVMLVQKKSLLKFATYISYASDEVAELLSRNVTGLLPQIATLNILVRYGDNKNVKPPHFQVKNKKYFVPNLCTTLRFPEHPGELINVQLLHDSEWNTLPTRTHSFSKFMHFRGNRKRHMRDVYFRLKETEKNFVSYEKKGRKLQWCTTQTLSEACKAIPFDSHNACHPRYKSDRKYGMKIKFMY